MKEKSDEKMWVPAGHFYSPIPSREDIASRRDQIYTARSTFSGIELQIEKQLALIREFRPIVVEIPFPDEQEPNFRYYFKNNFFSYGDAVSDLKENDILLIDSTHVSKVGSDVNHIFLIFYHHWRGVYWYIYMIFFQTLSYPTIGLWRVDPGMNVTCCVLF